MSGVVRTIWDAGLAVTLVFLPLVVGLLHRVWRAARSIQLYSRDAVTATNGIAENIAKIALLDQTIETTALILSAASGVERTLRSAKELHGWRSES